MKVEFEGTSHFFPDDFTPKDIAAALGGFGKPKPKMDMGSGAKTPTRESMLAALDKNKPGIGAPAKMPSAASMRRLATKPDAAPQYVPNLSGVVRRSTGRAVAPTLGGLGGAVTGAGLGAALGAVFPPAEVVTIPAGAIIGGLGGAMATSGAQDFMMEQFPELAKKFGQSPEQRKADVAAYPTAEFAAGFIPSLVTGRPSISPQTVRKGAGLISRTFANPVTGNLALGTIGGGLETGRELVAGEDFDLKKVGIAAAAAAATRSPYGKAQMPDSVLEEAIRKSRGPFTGRRTARQQGANVAAANTATRTGLAEAGVPVTPLDILPGSTAQRVSEAAGRGDPARDLAAKYIETTTAALPNVARTRTEELTPTDTRTRAQAEADVATDIGNAPPAYREVVPGEGGAAGQAKLMAEKEAMIANENRLYDKAREASPNSAQLDPEVKPAFSQGLRQALTDYALEDLPRISGHLSRFDNMDDATARSLFELRQRVGKLSQSNDLMEAGAAKKLVRAIDDQMDKGLADGAFVGDPKEITAWRTAIAARRARGAAFEGDDVVQSLTATTRRDGGQIQPDIAPEAASQRLLGSGPSVRQTGDRTRDLRLFRDRVGADSPEWDAVRREAIQKEITASGNFDRLKRESPDLAALLIRAEDEAALAMRQRAVSAGEARTGAIEMGGDLLRAQPADFTASVGNMSPAALRDARVAARQAITTGLASPRQSMGMLSDLVSNDIARANLVTLFGQDEAKRLLSAADALVKRQTKVETLRPTGRQPEDTSGVPEMLSTAVQIKTAGAFAPAFNFLKGRGLNDAEAAAMVEDAIDPSKAAAIEAFIAKTYGDSFAKAFAGRMNAAKAKMPIKTAGPLVQSLSQTVQTKPEDDEAPISTDFSPRAWPEGENPSLVPEGEMPEAPREGVAGTSIGMRNNNAGNLRDGKFAQSQSGYVGADDNGFAIFETPEDGEQAQERLLRNSYLAKGHNTIDKIIERYNPRADPRNTPEVMRNYKTFVADRLGIGINDKIDVSMLEALAEAQRAFETGNY
jgi:hypothetical protein